jgi:hypothetical protein
MAIPLVNANDVISPRSRERTIEKENIGKTIIKKKPERPVRILRIRYYEKISLPFMQDDKLASKDAFAVNRSLEDLLKAFGFNTKIKGTITSHDCIVVEKGSRMGANEKFLFIDIGTNDFYTLKKQMENHTTICAFNQGEFIILDGRRSSLTETFDIPKKLKEEVKDTISHGNSKIDATEILRKKLKDDFRQYHLYEDERIDRMTGQDLLELKRIVNRKIEKKNMNRKFYKDLLK